MTDPQGIRCVANVNPDASGGADPDKTIKPGDFTTVDGTSLTASEAVVVRSIIHGNDYTLNRLGDPDGDGAFEINVQIESVTGAGESIRNTYIITDVAGLEIVNDAGSSQQVTLIGQFGHRNSVFVEQNDAVADGSEVARTTGARQQIETIYELVMSGDADLDRRHDPNDDGTFELDANVESYTGAQVVRETWLPMSDESGRTNAEMETALVASGGSRDLMILGTLGVTV